MILGCYFNWIHYQKRWVGCVSHFPRVHFVEHTGNKSFVVSHRESTTANEETNTCAPHVTIC